MGDKADYVKSQGQTRAHECHWPTCKRQVPPALYMCKEHWLMLPKALRNKVWAAYVPGQEVTMTPSAKYLEVVAEVEDWIRTEGHALEQKKLEKAGQLNLFDKPK
jgi:hypothetical protein